MRILVVGAVSGATVDICSSLAHAFTGLGKECRFLDFSEYDQEFHKVDSVRKDADMHGFVIRLQTRLLEEVILFNPSLIIGLAQSPLNNLEVLDSFRKSGIKLNYWFLEDYRVFQYWSKIAPKFDHFFTIQKSPLLKELKNNSSFYVSQYVRIEHERIVAYVKNNHFILKLQTFKPRRQ
jgi:spore maturation protein CgeB